MHTLYRWFTLEKSFIASKTYKFQSVSKHTVWGMRQTFYFIFYLGSHSWHTLFHKIEIIKYGHKFIIFEVGGVKKDDQKTDTGGKTDPTSKFCWPQAHTWQPLWFQNREISLFIRSERGSLPIWGLMSFLRIKNAPACQTLGWTNDQIWSVWAV